ncbi:MAG: response regulator [Kiritimatiellae bacterium]|nr:response regulator [Kiritimatiellia bacterium]
MPNAAEQVVADDAQTEMPEVGQVAGGRSHRRILIADDSSINLAVLASLLRHVGDFDIVTAADGRIALDILQAPDAKPFDLVLTDIWMPNFNGEDLLKAIRSNPTLSSLRVIAVTADVKLRGKAAEMGFDDILLKPLNGAMLSDAILGQGKK